VTSSPPRTARKGATYTHRLVVKSKQGGVKCRMEAGPAGMKVSPEGRINWEVPADYANPDVDIILAISDQSGQELFQTIKIVITK